MAVAGLSHLKRALCSPSPRLVLASQSRRIGHSTPLSEELKDTTDAELGLGHEKDDAGTDSSSALVESDDSKALPANTRPYADELRGIMAAKYFSNQPVAKPHSHCKKASEKLTLQGLRAQYDHRLSALRKKYAREVEEKKAAKATHDKKQREEILLAKEERLRLKKEKSAQRAVEVQAERQLLQDQLARERAERQSHRKQMDLKVEERRQKERDIIRQQSGTWIGEKDLELRIIQALANPIDL